MTVTEYDIKGYLIKGNELDNRITVRCANFTDVVEFLSKVSLEAYDVVKVLPSK